MRYAMFDIDVTDPFTDLVVPSGDVGAAVLVRRKGVPIGFWMQPVNRCGRVSANDLAQKIGIDIASPIVAESIAGELTTPPDSMVLPSLTIAICTKDRTEGVERLLRSLHLVMPGLPEATARPEILIIDNAPSDDRTRDLAGQWPGVRYVCEPRPGLNFARNRALRETQREILAFLDDDVIVDRHWLRGFAAAWEGNRDAAAFTGQVLPMELETEAQILFERRGGFRRGFERIRYGAVSPGNPLYPGGAGNFGAGANMAFKVEVLRELGGFDEALDTGAMVPGGGDLDAFYRVIRAGHALVYEPQFLVFHQHRRDMRALRRQYRRSWGLGFMCYVTKCIKSDPDRKVQLYRLIIWWFTHHLTALAKQLMYRSSVERILPTHMLIGELWGGMIGLLGGYGRSQRQVAKIRKDFA